MADIEVKTGEIKVLNGAGQLTATGIGSCLIITLYDANKKIAAMAHAMLPRETGFVKREAARYASRDTRYVNEAIEAMLDKMEKMGASRRNTEAKLVGGANMFSAFETDIGKDNVISAKDKLKTEGIKLVGESVGGSIGRSVEFCVASGLVTVKVKF